MSKYVEVASVTASAIEDTDLGSWLETGNPNAFAVEGGTKSSWDGPRYNLRGIEGAYLQTLFSVITYDEYCVTRGFIPEVADTTTIEVVPDSPQNEAKVSAFTTMPWPDHITVVKGAKDVCFVDHFDDNDIHPDLQQVFIEELRLNWDKYRNTAIGRQVYAEAWITDTDPAAAKEAWKGASIHQFMAAAYATEWYERNSAFFDSKAGCVYIGAIKLTVNEALGVFSAVAATANTKDVWHNWEGTSVAVTVQSDLYDEVFDFTAFMKGKEVELLNAAKVLKRQVVSKLLH